MKEKIKAEAERLGFCLCGFTNAETPEDFSRYLKWLSENSFGTMGYLKRDDTLAKRADPRLLLPDAQTICVLAVPMELFPQHSSFSVASYAHYMDYHDTILPMAENLVSYIHYGKSHLLTSFSSSSRSYSLSEKILFLNFALFRSVEYFSTSIYNAPSPLVPP